MCCVLELQLEASSWTAPGQREEFCREHELQAEAHRDHWSAFLQGTGECEPPLNVWNLLVGNVSF